MRWINAMAVALTLSALAACGGSDGARKAQETPAPSALVYDGCELLTQAERNTAVGVLVDYQGAPDFYFPNWACKFGDAPDVGAEASVEYRAMRASVWAERVPYILETTPSESKPKEFLAELLSRSGRSVAELSELDDFAACDVWDAFEATRRSVVVKHTMVESQSAEDGSWQSAIAETCRNGIYASVQVLAKDADSENGRERALRALNAVFTRASAKLPQDT